MSRKLIVDDGRRQRELLLVSKLVVGRDPTCDLSEADPLLSRRHAEFTVSGDDIVVRDLGSRNGIYVNGARMAESVLQSGDVIRIGHLQMRYLEDSAPLVSMPELADDATGLVIPGPRPGTPKPPQSMAAPKPSSISGSMQRPAPPSSTPRPSLSSSQRPAAAPPDEHDADVTSYVSPSSARRSQIGLPPPSARKIPAPPPTPSRSASQPVPAPPPVAEDQSEQTRVVPAPGRTGLRPKTEPLEPAIGERTSVLPPPKSRTAVQPPAVEPPAVHPPAMQSPLIGHTSVLPPPVPSAQSAMLTGVQPPPAPPEEDIDEPTSVVLMPRPGTRTGVPAAAAASANGREARAIALAVDAIAAFLGSAAIGRNAADAVKVLEKDLASAGPPADLVAALKDLAARLTAAAHELT